LNNRNEATSNLGELLKKGMLGLETQAPAEHSEAKESDEKPDNEGGSTDNSAVETQA